MRDQQTIVGGAIIGAVLGAVAGYLFFTERGRRFRREVEPQLQTIVREAMQLGKTVNELRRKPSQDAPRAGAAPLAWPRRS
jgi:gas vesicle protein